LGTKLIIIILSLPFFCFIDEFAMPPPFDADEELEEDDEVEEVEEVKEEFIIADADAAGDGPMPVGSWLLATNLLRRPKRKFLKFI
jgi:hypothetical protein